MGTSMSLRLYGSMGGSMSLWVYGSMCLCVYVSMGLWVYGSMGLWVYRFTGLWVYSSKIYYSTHTRDNPSRLFSLKKLKKCFFVIFCNEHILIIRFNFFNKLVQTRP
jgi:hypothetical protein